jgi:GTPase SAR1 family protein
LLEDEGAGPERRLKLSQLALHILLDERPQSEDREACIRRAALTPKIFRELWDKWAETGLPSNANMQHTLIFEHHFPEKRVQEFIRVFRETVEYAGLLREDSTTPSPEKSQIQSGVEDVDSTTDTTSKDILESTLKDEVEAQPNVTLGKSSLMKQDTLDLDEGIAVLQWPANISKSSLQEIRDWLDFQLRRMESRANRQG